MFVPDGDLVRLVAGQLRLNGIRLRLVQGRIEPTIPIIRPLAREMFESVQPVLLVAYDGKRRNRPGGVGHLFVCSECPNWLVTSATRGKRGCNFCGAKKGCLEKIELDFVDLPKRPRRKVG